MNTAMNKAVPSYDVFHVFFVIFCYFFHIKTTNQKQSSEEMGLEDPNVEKQQSRGPQMNN